MRPPLKILQVGNTDLVGKRFNGQDLHRRLRERGHASQHCVWSRQGNDDGTWELTRFRYRGLLNDVLCGGIERRLSIQALLYPFSHRLPFDPRFRGVDVVHYHLIHSRFFSLLSLPLLTRRKPSVWTLHDPWAMTGHCLYPFDCERWLTGCGSCPRLDTEFALAKDRTAFLFKTKDRVYGASKVDLVVASQWMHDMARRSPLTARFRLHRVPFGLDLSLFRPTDSDAAKRRLGVIPGSLVVCFRSTPSQFKGLPFIKDALHRLATDRPVCLLTFNDRGLVDEFRGRYQIVELGWVDDDALLVDAYNAADVFLMPSTAEAFGMMAMEAMACGKPVVVFDGTSLPGVVFAPDGGISVGQGDAGALAAALARLLGSDAERLRIGERALALAREHYDVERYVDGILDVYREVIARRAAEHGSRAV